MYPKRKNGKEKVFSYINAFCLQPSYRNTTMLIQCQCGLKMSHNKNNYKLLSAITLKWSIVRIRNSVGKLMHTNKLKRE